MPFPAPTRRPRNGFFDLIAPFWDALAGRWAAGAVSEALALSGDQRVLDLAGGTGRLARLLAPHCRQVVVADLSAPMARRAARHGLAAARSRAEALPFPGKSFERVIVVDALHHMGDLEAVAAEIARVLTPGGLAVLFEPDPASLRGSWIARLERWAGFGSLFLPADQLEELFARQGLTVSLDRRSFHLRLRACKAG
ncbi:MAG TPA: class I SAM-dependent methyltransferase [Acidobacteria bacterium]|nr:class I SAM-dependent methyltransferase [Acidobacteriota bacterium]